MENKKVLKKIEDELEKNTIEQDKMKELEILQDYSGRDEVITSKEALENIAEERKNPPVRFKSGIPTLDSILGGFGTGEVVVISGITKSGKTSLLQTFTHHFSKQEIPCLWFSYELQQRDFLEKFGEPIPYFTLPKNLTDNSLDWLENRIVESFSKYQTRIVMIDHLHFLIPLEQISQRAGISLLIGGIMRELKKLAIRWNLCIFLVCHTVKVNYDRKPELMDIRDSSFIAQESDFVLMIYRLKEKGTDQYSNEARLVVQANRRNGATGGINLIFQDGQFYERDNSEREYPEAGKETAWTDI